MREKEKKNNFNAIPASLSISFYPRIWNGDRAAGSQLRGIKAEGNLDWSGKRGRISRVTLSVQTKAILYLM